MKLHYLTIVVALAVAYNSASASAQVLNCTADEASTVKSVLAQNLIKSTCTTMKFDAKGMAVLTDLTYCSNAKCIKAIKQVKKALPKCKINGVNARSTVKKMSKTCGGGSSGGADDDDGDDGDDDDGSTPGPTPTLAATTPTPTVTKAPMPTTSAPTPTKTSTSPTTSAPSPIPSTPAPTTSTPAVPWSPAPAKETPTPQISPSTTPATSAKGPRKGKDCHA